MTAWTRQDALKIRSILEKMDLCSCGTNAHWQCVLDVLQEAENHSQEGFYRDQWFEFGAKVLTSWELLEHGGSVGGSWLTDDGKLLLRFLNDFGLEGHDFNDGSGQPEWSIEFSWEDPGTDEDSFGRWEMGITKGYVQ